MVFIWADLHLRCSQKIKEIEKNIGKKDLVANVARFVQGFVNALRKV